MAAGLIQRGRVTGRAVAVGGAILAHAALLAPLALGALGEELERVEDDDAPVAMLIQLAPRSGLTPQSSTQAATRASTDSRLEGKSSPVSARSTPPRPTTGPTPALAEGAMAIDARWRVRPSIHGPGWGDCPEAFSNPSVQNICNERNRIRLAAAAPRPSEAQAPAPTLAPDAGPNGAFARTAAANQAWRDYTRNDGPYPGLKSLLRDH